MTKPIAEDELTECKRRIERLERRVETLTEKWRECEVRMIELCASALNLPIERRAIDQVFTCSLGTAHKGFGQCRGVHRWE